MQGTDSVDRDFDPLVVECTADYRAHPGLAKEFGDLAAFIAWRRAEARGVVSVLSKSKPPSAGGGSPSDAVLRREWVAQPARQREFGGDFAVFAAFRRAAGRGLVNICSSKRIV
jgi:hypothetical protein